MNKSYSDDLYNYEGPTPETPEELYLDLLKKCLTRYVFGETYSPVGAERGSIRGTLHALARPLLARLGLELVLRIPFDKKKIAEGQVWPLDAETMIGLRRLNNLQFCITDVLRRGVAGDLIETGVWRGGATIFMRAVLKTYGDTKRIVWVADSFQGLPEPDAGHYPMDSGNRLWAQTFLRVSLEEVKANFAKYDLLDDQVRFLVGWFCDTLPRAPIEQLAILRLDGDMYESTMVALRSLYPKLSVGGYVIIDDYSLPSCRAAVDDYRAEYGITEEMKQIDWSCVFWQRLR